MWSTGVRGFAAVFGGRTWQCIRVARSGRAYYEPRPHARHLQGSARVGASGKVFTPPGNAEGSAAGKASSLNGGDDSGYGLITRVIMRGAIYAPWDGNQIR